MKLQVSRIEVQRECRRSSQEELQNAIKPTSIEGVIYAIVHLPSQKLYVGQTINLGFGSIIGIPGMRVALSEMITFTE
jgi:hypothetical protein